MASEQIEAKLKTLPDKSGVYIMKDENGTVIYVGKAKVLKNRVRSYFKNHNHPPKVAAMVSNVATFEYIMTDSEMEALVLENNLIKEHSPKYNILLKDDKTYPFLKLTLQEEYPKLMMTRTVKRDGARYFGPYSSGILLRELLDLIKDIFKIRSCNHKFPADFGKSRPCLYHHIGKCLGVCTGDIDKAQYDAIIKEVIGFLNGNYTGVQKRLQAEMQAAAQALDFEKAALLRDRLQSIDVLSQKQKIVSALGNDVDALALYSKNNKSCVQIFFIRSGKIIGREHYIIDGTDGVEEAEVLTDFVKQYYAKSSFVPRELMLQYELEDADVIREWLSALCGRKVELKVPKIGENLQLINMIRANAKKELSEQELKILRDIKFKNRALASLYQILDLPEIPSRIEAYDISNISGDNNVASMVTFVDAKPSTKDYRNFRIKTVIGADDYACMEEALTRRLQHGLDEQARIDAGELDRAQAKFSVFPNVLFVDGGQGHVNVAQGVMDKLGLSIPVFGIVKDDSHRTRGVVSPDGEISIDKSSEAFMLLANIQDEMHRRAVSYHKQLHAKKTLASELENIAGVGEVRRKALQRHFKSMKAIRAASIEELSQVKGLDRRTAERIYSYFRQDNQ